MAMKNIAGVFCDYCQEAIDGPYAKLEFATVEELGNGITHEVWFAGDILPKEIHLHQSCLEECLEKIEV